MIGLCIGLFCIATLYKTPQSRYDQSSFSYYPIELMCDVIKIIDGDTLLLQCPNVTGNIKKTLRMIRLWGIDAPERKQGEWGNHATKMLKNLIGKNRLIKVQIIEQDRYQRMVGKLYLNDLDIGLEMVKQGVVSVYHHYNHDEVYINAEKKARISRLGIWSVSGA
ncbi:thermonuclease family protein [Wohlfahrtiimonas larvae]|uniref:TNase-like domain-containing protein n=1 Tax=Wohlfahrtiimonas larvae TaxID=1157986 RepID=A0ABP9MG71_9GAMM|nr:thermonuclease family protein [Wohlfahrtiimonas larvae]